MGAWKAPPPFRLRSLVPLQPLSRLRAHRAFLRCLLCRCRRHGLFFSVLNFYFLNTTTYEVENISGELIGDCLSSLAHCSVRWACIRPSLRLVPILEL